MFDCITPGCQGAALAEWWRMCLPCSRCFVESIESAPHLADQAAAAGFDAIDWSARIAPSAWGTASADDGWTSTVRCLSVAAALTGRARGCAHTVGHAGPVPVVAVWRVVGVLQCPPCAEQLVVETSRSAACDRCGRDEPLERIAALTGNSMIVVGQTCAACRHEVIGSDVITS